jgi:hypothetical protein
MLGNLDGTDRTVGFQPPTEAAADQMIVNDDLFRRQARGLRGHRLNPRHRLAADPDFAVIHAKVHRAIHRLHCRVGQERHLIGRLDFRGGTRHRRLGVTDVLRHCTSAQRRLFELARDVRCCEPGMRTIVPFDLERCETFLGSSHVIGDDRNGVIEPHDLAHALDRFRGRVIQALHAPAEDRRLHQGCNFHAGRTSVDAVHCRSIHLRRRIEPLGRGADQLETRRHACRNLNLRGLRGQLGVFEPAPARHVNHLTIARATGFGIDAPALGRGRNQHGPCGGAGLAQRLPRTAHRV